MGLSWFGCEADSFMHFVHCDCVAGDGRTSSASVINDEKMTGGQTVGTLPSMTGARPVTPPLVETVITAASPLQGDPKQPSRYIGLSKSEVQADTSATEFLIVGAPEAADRSKSRKSSGNSNRSARSARSARSSGTTASREASCTSRKLAGIANPSESLEVSVKSRRGSAAELRKRPRQTIANASSSEDLSASARATDSSTPASSPPSASTSGVAAPKHVQKNVNSPLPEAMPRRAAKKVAAQVVQDSASAIQDAVSWLFKPFETGEHLADGLLMPGSECRSIEYQHHLYARGGHSIFYLIITKSPRHLNSVCDLFLSVVACFSPCVIALAV